MPLATIALICYLPECNNIFIRKKNSQKYCSPNCRKKKKPSKCKNSLCNKQRARGDRDHCRICAILMNVYGSYEMPDDFEDPALGKAKVSTEKIKCLNKLCSNIYIKTSSRQLYCSVSCRPKYDERKNVCLEPTCDNKTTGSRCPDHAYENIRSDLVEKIGDKTYNDSGYVILYVGWNEKLNSNNSPRMAEHRFVMSKFLNRAVLTEETVHHKNGVRDDNRIENLELWTGKHQPGVRVEDHIRHMIFLYREDIIRLLNE